MDKEPRLDRKITDDVKEYVRMRMDAAKLGLVEDLSGLAGGAIALIIMLLLFTLALTLFTGVLAYALSLMLSCSMVWAAAIIGGIYVIAGIIVFANRRFFISKMVKTFSYIFFKENGKEAEDE